ncbi:hypothetical protein EXN66_Car017228 [Channa argus]|uniref:Uncharacterized protein n=1 Tax=Channa argus TaxID=215402 RepID=A0A6G1QFT2_CHAAH|nr:hypothetical protein EXN66_Car017228 [Channa argus]
MHSLSVLLGKEIDSGYKKVSTSCQFHVKVKTDVYKVIKFSKKKILKSENK